ncbi:MAG TPA: RtcB family protein [Acholeplasmataceae bacterium]|nr:RtcB family protein [Acholeplasmataceae bacterium]
MLSRGDNIKSIEERLLSDDLIFNCKNIKKIDFYIENNDEPLIHHAKLIYEKYEAFKNQEVIEIKGNYTNAKIFTKNVEQAVIDQLQTIVDSPYAKDTKIRVMPDAHSGFGVPIGYTQNLNDKVVPNFVGVDIGCGMLVSKLANYSDYPVNFFRLEKVITENVPSGFNVFNEKQVLQLNLEDLIAEINLDRAYKSVGTLGGGNHFIELNQSEKGLYLVIHSGSRHLGVEVCNYWQKRIDNNLGYLTGSDFNGYLNDMKIAQEFASLNRKRMRDTIFNKMKWDLLDEFETVHNYIDLEHMILRKGAISARKDEKVIIPINMRDGSLIAKGLGNSDWNYSAPHGAGRIMSRTEAKQRLDIKEFKDTMKDVWSNSVSKKTLDESPFVYKDINEIINNTKDTILIIEKLKVLYNYKA